MCGIFAYLNYCTPKARAEIVELLINGLKRLEYRGYDSAGNDKYIFLKNQCFFFWISKNLILLLLFFQLGIGIDGGESDDNIVLVKKKGKVKALEDEIKTQADSLDLEGTHHVHVGIAHTRWATHGPPSEVSIIWLVCLLSQHIAWNIATTVIPWLLG